MPKKFSANATNGNGNGSSKEKPIPRPFDDLDDEINLEIEEVGGFY